MGRPLGFASTVGRMNRLLGLSPGVGRLCTNAALSGIIHMDFRHARNLSDQEESIVWLAIYLLRVASGN